MFTGIVQATGRIVRLDPLEIDCPALDRKDEAIGDSISVPTPGGDRSYEILGIKFL